MAYDEELGDRIRELVSDEPDLSEQKMFGGLAYLIGATWPSPRAAKAEYWFA